MWQAHPVVLKCSPEVKRVILAADASYRKREARLLVQPEIDLYGTYWDGGTRYSYTAVDLVTGRSKGAPQFDPPQFGGPATTPRVSIPQGVAIVKTGMFCGKTATAYVYINPADAAPLLPA